MDERAAELERHVGQARSALAAARAAPMSRKKAMLAALLIDAAADALFAASGETGLLAYRAGLAAKSEPLALVFALAALDPEGARLVTEPVEVPLAEYGQLDVADFMVSLYNERTVPRVLIALGEERHDVHEVLAAGLAVLIAE